MIPTRRLLAFVGLSTIATFGTTGYLLIQDLSRIDAPQVFGCARSDEVLIEAGIERAPAIVIETGSDSDDRFVTVSARENNPTLRIHARGESGAGIRRLELAGARQVVSADPTGGRSALIGRGTGSIEQETPRVRRIALQRGEARIRLMPAEATDVSEGDRLVVIGARGSLAKLARVAGGSAGEAAP